MKSLSLSRPLVIMVIGLPGSGKSFFARQFADMFSAPLVSADFIRHAVTHESDYSAREDALVTTLMHNEITELFKTAKTFVIDGGMNARANRTAVERAASRHGYNKMVIWVQTDEHTSISRSVKRSDKRKGDELNDSMSIEAFERYKKQFSNPSPSENVVVISGKHTYATQARVILKKLVAPRDTVTPERADHTRHVAIQTEQPTDDRPRRRNVTIN
jgi:predicted kinase